MTYDKIGFGVSLSMLDIDMLTIDQGGTKMLVAIKAGRSPFPLFIEVSESYGGSPFWFFGLSYDHRL
ncbi:MAG: hypothetical protein IPH36_19280 [Saprospiraceae bacterium]|nr:hypothetical protein [Saprospiraceae bacterium]